MDRTRFLIIDDHPLVRRGIKATLTDQVEFEVVGAVGTLAEGLSCLADNEVDIAIVDLGLPDGNGLEFISRSRHESPSTKVIVSSMRDERIFAQRCIVEGARAYVAKQDAETVLLDAIAEVIAGRTYLSETAREFTTDEVTHNRLDPKHASAYASLSRLSSRELSVFELIGMGYSTKKISEMMGVKTKTIDSFRERIKNKLELGSSNELLAFATRWLVSFEDD